MSWFRVGDTAATDPRILALEDPRDPLLGTTCFGFLVKLGTQSANHFTDYVIHPGFLTLAGGPSAPKLLRRCIAAGLIIDLGGRGPDRRWKLIDTAPELFHIRLKAEVDWEKQQKADTQNPEFQAAVWLRDGDSCRWCGRVVQPSDNRSYRGKTMDHLRTGQRARGPEDLVVACRGCNGRRGQDWQDEDARAGFDDRWQLRTPPSPLIFIRSTVEWLQERGHAIPPGSVIAERAPKPDRDTPTSGPEVSRSTSQANAAAPAQGTTAPDDQHPTSQVGVAASESRTDGVTRPASQAGAAAPSAASPSAPECQHPAPAGVAAPESRTDRSPTDRFGTAGPGRVGSGSGRAGSGGFPPSRASPAVPPPGPTSSTEPRRTRRGRRRSRSGGTPT